MTHVSDNLIDTNPAIAAALQPPCNGFWDCAKPNIAGTRSNHCPECNLLSISGGRPGVNPASHRVCHPCTSR
jgi:hypothetical protein